MEVKEKGDRLIITDTGWRLILKHDVETGELRIGQGETGEHIMSGAFIADFDVVLRWMVKRAGLAEVLLQTPFDKIMAGMQTWLETAYPAEQFTGESGDQGAVIVAGIRDVLGKHWKN